MANGTEFRLAYFTATPILEHSRYGSAYLFNMMGIGGPSVYEWQRRPGWRKLPKATDHTQGSRPKLAEPPHFTIKQLPNQLSISIGGRFRPMQNFPPEWDSGSEETRPTQNAGRLSGRLWTGSTCGAGSRTIRIPECVTAPVGASKLPTQTKRS